MMIFKIWKFADHDAEKPASYPEAQLEDG